VTTRGGGRSTAAADLARVGVSHRALLTSVAGTADPTALADMVHRWCGEELGAAPTGLRWAAAGSALVVAADLADGRSVVVKARPAAQAARAADAMAVQAGLGRAGLPVPIPVGEGGPRPFGPGIATAEERLEGTAVDGTGPDAAELLARTLHRLVDVATALGSDLPRLHRPWGVALPASQLWPDPPHDPGFDLVGTAAGAGWIDELAMGFRRRLAIAAEPGPDEVVGHADWRAEHVLVDRNRTHVGGRPPDRDGHGGRTPDGDGTATPAVVGILDCDSLVRAPVPVLVGMAAAGFAIDHTATVVAHPDVASSRAFVAAYERARGRAFDGSERDLLDAAHGWVVAYGARCEHSDERTGRGGGPARGWRDQLAERGARALV
jgi:hypothetical protein